MKYFLPVLSISLLAGCGDSESGAANDAGSLDAQDAGADDVALNDAGSLDAQDAGADDVELNDVTVSEDGTTSAPDLLSIDDVTYLGAFRVSSGDFGDSNSNYAVGALGYNPVNHSIYLAGHAHHNAIAEFAIPTLGQATDVQSLPLVETPLQPFTTVLDSTPNGNPDELDRITGLLWIDGSLLVNAERWYDAGGTAKDTTLVVRDADQLDGVVDGYFALEGAAHAGGYMGSVPAAWQEALGGTHFTGWASNYSIISRYSVGPSLFLFDPLDILGTGAGANGSVSTLVRMDFPHSGQRFLGADALSTEEGSAPALWNFLSRAVYAFIVPGTRTFAVFGKSGGVDSGIGYKITQDDGNLCGGYCAYAADDYYNYYWFFDLDEILSAGEPHEPRPYAFGRWSVPFDDGGRHSIIGGTFDTTNGVLYLTLGKAGRVGDYDRPPLLLAFSILP